jgi:diguanylate cyclase (GGDEF)-like protein
MMQTNSRIDVLEQLIDSLQACFSVEEAYTTIKPLMEQLFPDESGAIYVVTPSKNLLKAIATWGPIPLTSDPIFTPNECLALQRKKTHLVEDTHNGLCCQHIRPNSLPVETFCVPMTVHGDTLGVLYVSSLVRGGISQTEQLAISVAKHIGLALANLRLRETLNNQSFRDPISKVYNRRYLEECLEREIQRSEHQPRPLGVILFKLDGFQDFINIFGYKIGDLLLREMGTFLTHQIRASDIACRYRGDEFLILLPEASLSATQSQAELLRQHIKNLTITYKNRTLDSITISCGVASFSEHGMTGRELIQAANAALQRAKEQGSDRIVVASSLAQTA